MNIKNEIVSTARVLFGERGIFETRVVDITNKLRISKKTFYKYFDSKDELVSIIFNERMDYFRHSVDAIFDSEKPFPEKIAGYVAFLKSNMPEVSRKHLQDVCEFSSSFEASINAYLESSIFCRFPALIESGKQEGCLKPDVNLNSIILLFRDSVMNFYAVLSGEDLPESLQSSPPAELLYESVITIFRGILNNEAEKEFDKLLEGDTLRHI